MVKFRSQAKNAVLRAGRTALRRVGRGLRIANPQVHAKLANLANRANYYVKEGAGLVKDVGVAGGAIAAGVATGGWAAAPAAMLAADRGIAISKRIRKLVPEIKRDVAEVKQDLPTGKQFLKKSGTNLKKAAVEGGKQFVREKVQDLKSEVNRVKKNPSIAADRLEQIVRIGASKAPR